MKLTKSKTVAYIFLIALTVIWVVPLIFGIFTSFKSETEISAVGFKLLPIHWTLGNYVEVLSNTTNAPMLKWYVNSIIISVTHTVLVLIIVSLASYGYTRIKFKGRDLLFWVLMSASMFPSVVNIIPTYKIVDSLGWVNTVWSCIVPGLGGVANIFLVRQFMLGIPMEYDESAKMDGASDFTIYSRVILPLIKPILTVVALFTFTGSWNDFLWPSIVFNDIDKMTVTAGLQLLKGIYGDYIKVGSLMSSAVLALVPTFLLFLFAQKYFMESMSLSTGVKG
ncbi:ABC transporter permease [Enterococcus sp. JM4C]|uniref:carbohydrate ABC transporter permease n=1 Tax=Candidatus Enterococcus huntleyi TaxID=1857217 RepID=UPI00137AF275|nr:carbohydrate ABC transporter permease [Enterococcus sp. JM4C]KAF1295123.1 ABC transporter permease [Enterococcus sp. JM4C]